MKHYSPSTRGFYDDQEHGAARPEDAVAISDELYAQLQAGFGAGKQIVMVEGLPVPSDPPPPDTEQCWTNLRAERNNKLFKTDHLVMRHRDQVEQNHPTSLTGDEYTALQAYRQALRDLPENTSDPAAPVWPQYPL